MKHEAEKSSWRREVKVARDVKLVGYINHGSAKYVYEESGESSVRVGLHEVCECLLNVGYVFFNE